MNKCKICIWSRDFELPVCLHCYSDETVTDIQNQAIDIFLERTFILDDAKNEVEKYVLQHQTEGIHLDSVDNIFKYVMPKRIYVPRSAERIVAVLCNFKFDMEHGIAIVFENEKLKEVGTQDIIL